MLRFSPPQNQWVRGGRQQSSLLSWPSLPVSWTKQGWDNKQTREQWPISHVQSQRSVSGWRLIVSACYRLSPRQLVSACWHDVEEWRWPPHLPTATVTSCLKKEECFQDKSKLLIVFLPAFYFCSCGKVKSAGAIIFMRHLPIFNIVYSPQAKPSHLYACSISLTLARLSESAGVLLLCWPGSTLDCVLKAGSCSKGLKCFINLSWKLKGTEDAGSVFLLTHVLCHVC